MLTPTKVEWISRRLASNAGLTLQILKHSPAPPDLALRPTPPAFSAGMATVAVLRAADPSP